MKFLLITIIILLLLLKNKKEKFSIISIIPIYTKIKEYYKLNPVLKNNKITFKDLEKYENINNSRLKIKDNKNKLSNLCPFIYKRLDNMMLDDKKIKTNLEKLRESIFNLSKEIIEETYKKKVSYSNLI